MIAQAEYRKRAIVNDKDLHSVAQNVTPSNQKKLQDLNFVSVQLEMQEASTINVNSSNQHVDETTYSRTVTMVTYNRANDMPRSISSFLNWRSFTNTGKKLVYFWFIFLLMFVGKLVSRLFFQLVAWWVG